MPNPATFATRVEQFSAQAKQAADDYAGWFGSIKGLILNHFGQNGLYAAYILLAALVVLVVSRMTKITFATVKYLVIPAVGVAFIGSLFTGYSFIHLLPMTVTLFSLVLLFKG